MKGFVERSLARRGSTEKFPYELTDETQQERLERDAGLVVEKGTEHTLSADYLRHALEEHGNATVEAARAQLAIKAEDFLFLPEIVKRPDRVSKSDRPGEDDLQRIRYEKQINGLIYVVEEHHPAGGWT